MQRFDVVYKVLVIPIASPILVGIYDKNDNLIKSISNDGKTSDILPAIFKEILDNFKLDSILYVNGPGSYMSIKVAYLFLKTLSIVKTIELKATNGFNFNQNSPIKALGKKYFINSKDDTITVEFLKENQQLKEFLLPDKLDISLFSKDSFK